MSEMHTSLNLIKYALINYVFNGKRVVLVAHFGNIEMIERGKKVMNVLGKMYGSSVGLFVGILIKKFIRKNDIQIIPLLYSFFIDIYLALKSL